MIIPISLFLTGLLPGPYDHWRAQLCYGMMAVVAIMGAKIWKNIHWSAAVAFMVTGFNTAFMTFSPTSIWSAWGVSAEVAFDSVAGQSGFLFLGIVAVFLIASEKDMDSWAVGFGYLGLFSSILMVSNWLRHLSPDGILSNPAIDASFVACLYPLMVLRKTGSPWGTSVENAHKYPVQLVISVMLCVMPPLAILLSKSNTGLALLAGELLLYYAVQKRLNPSRFIFIMVMIFATYGITKVLLGTKFMNNDGRFQVWKMLVAHFIGLRNFVWGNGAGSFRLMGPITQHLNGYNSQVFIWGHNEYLQVLFEQGIAGLISCLVLFYCMLKRSFREPWVFVTVAGLGVTALTQFSFRVIPFALFNAYMVKVCWGDNDKKS